MGRLESKDLLGHQQSVLGDPLDVVRNVAGMDLSKMAVSRANQRRTLPNAVCDIDEKNMTKVAAILGVTPAWLTSGAGGGPEVQNPEDDMINFMRWELERLMRMHDETAAMIETLHRRIADLEQDSRM